MTHIDAHQAWCHDCGTNQYLVSAYYVRVHRSSLLLFLIFNRSKGEKCPQNDAYTVEDCTLDSIHSIHQSLDLKLKQKFDGGMIWNQFLFSNSFLYSKQPLRPFSLQETQISERYFFPFKNILKPQVFFSYAFAIWAAMTIFIKNHYNKPRSI